MNQWLEFHANIWTLLVAVITSIPPTIAAITAMRTARKSIDKIEAVKGKVETVDSKIQTVEETVNGNFTALVTRNRELTQLLSEHNVTIPAELEEK